MITLRNVTSPAETTSAPGVDAISLTIRGGEIVSVLGLSSSARRRLLGVLSLHAEDWSGEYELFGHHVHRLDQSERAALRGEMVGSLMRSTPLVECLSVEENLEIPLTYRGVAADERSELIGEALSRLGVLSIRDVEVDTLPMDQRQLVGIAKALVSNPRLVLLEEPAQHLSPLQIRRVSRELDRLREDGCIVVQALEQVESGVEADRVVELDEVGSGRRGTRRSKHDPHRLNGVVGLC